MNEVQTFLCLNYKDYYKSRKLKNIIKFKYITIEEFYNISDWTDRIFINLFDMLAKIYYDLDFSNSKVIVIGQDFYIKGVNRYE